MKTGERQRLLRRAARASAPGPFAQVVSTVKIDRRDDQREPAAVRDLGDVRGEEGAVDEQRTGRSSAAASSRFHFQTWKISTASIIVVMIIVPLTAMP